MQLFRLSIDSFRLYRCDSRLLSIRGRRVGGLGTALGRLPAVLMALLLLPHQVLDLAPGLDVGILGRTAFPLAIRQAPLQIRDVLLYVDEHLPFVLQHFRSRVRAATSVRRVVTDFERHDRLKSSNGTERQRL